MGGKMSAEWWREYRRTHKGRIRHNERLRRQSSTKLRQQRHRQEVRRRARRRAEDDWDIPPLYPHLQRGVDVAWWHDELAIDLAQEYHLAVLEGRNPDIAAGRYRERELNWFEWTVPLFEAR